SLDSSSAPPHRAEIVEREANAHSLCRSEHDLVVIPNDACIEELIAIIEPDRHDARLSDVGISIEERALHLAALRHREERGIFMELTHGNHDREALILLEADEVHNGPPPRCATTLGDLINALSVDTPFIREEKKGRVCVHDEDA